MAMPAKIVAPGATAGGLIVYTALATLESDCAFRPATAYCVCEVVTVKSPQTVELATQFVPELVVMAVPVVHPVPAPFVTGGFVVP